MNSSIQESLARLAKQNQETTLLVDPTTIERVLKSDTDFATTAFCCEVIGPLRQKMDISYSGRSTSSSWEGIDENQTLVGYLSHNKLKLRFQTKETTVFELPFSDLKIEQHGLGLLVTTSSKSFVIGNYGEINEQLSPQSKMNYNFGSESTIWMRELGDLGVIDKAAWQKSRSNSKLFMLLWMLVVLGLSALIIFL